MANKYNISIIVPVYNEEGSLQELYSEISNSIKDIFQWEIIFIDDGSKDQSYSILKKIAEKDDHIVIISLYKNFGKAYALSTGFNQAKGDIIITMDADLQDDPAEIINLINKIEDGWDLVSGWKKDRKDPLSKRIPSKFFNFITRIITGLKIHDFNCGLKAYKRKVINAIEIYGGLHRYIPALAYHHGFTITEIEVYHRSRKFGNSKYDSRRLFHGFFDLFTMLFTTRYFNRPLHFFGSIGLFLFILGLILCIYLTIGWFQGVWIGNRPILFLGILLVIIGIQFFSLGLLGELFIKNTKHTDKKNHTIFTSRLK